MQDIATDVSDNFYALGYFTNQITDPVTITTSSTITKTFLLKYDASGTLSWNKGIYSSGSGSVKSYRVAVDNAGNVFIAGSLYGSTIYFNGFSVPSSFNGPNVLTPDGFIAKYSSTGAFLWVRAIGSTANSDEILDMALDANGDVYVTGYIAADASVYGKDNGGTQATTGTITTQGGAVGLLDVVVAKFANDGTYQWGFTVGSTGGAEKGTAITTDASNNVYVAGQLFNTMDFDPGAATVTLTEVSPQGSGDAFIAKYTTAGIFTNVGQISGASVELVNRMHVGASGALNVAGTFTGFIDADPRSANTQNLTAAGTGKDILFAKYDLTTFAPVFAQKMGASNSDDEAIGIRSNSSGDCYLTGYFSGSGVNFNPAGTALNLSSTGGKDAFISKYNATGVNTWGFSVGSATDDQGTSMDFNSAGFAYAGGFYTGSIGDFDPGAGSSTLGNLGLEDTYWSKYQECNSVPVISTQPASKTICAGTTLNLSIVATGSALTYQWKKGGVALTDGGTVSGATTANLSITSVVAGDAGTYTCVVSSCGNNVTSGNAVVTINQPPSITTQPVSSSICTGSNTSFSVSATGTLLTYQWKLDGVNISNNAVYGGANAATLNLVAPTTAHQGTYTVDITGTCSPVVTSNGVTLTVGSGITITTNPTNKTACLGGTTSFSVAATGSGLSYKWQKNGVDMSDGGSISGASTNTLTITGVIAGDATNYKCVITGTCGTATSTAATLTITSSPVITSQPVASQSICAGLNASFSVVATGAVSYQWKKNGVDLTNTGNISGALSASLLVSSITAADAGTYSCVVTGACSPAATSNNAVLTINTLPAITTQPAASTICSGANASFSITATGTGITYQWKKNGVDVVNSSNVFGATSSSLTITGVAVSDAGNYTCVVSGACLPAVTSNIAALTVNSTAAISSNPLAATVCAGQTASFTLGTTGSGITYQWKKGGVAITDGGNISGALTSVLTITGTTSGDAGSYSCTINNACSGVLNSTAATLTVRDLPAITIQPSDVTICGSANVNFTIAATGTGITYQWKKGGVALTDGGAISGATTASLSISPAVAADAGAYTCTVSGSCTPAVTSNTANLAVGSVATITSQPSDKTACIGSTVTLSIVVSGTGISYQWQKNGVDLVNDSRISGVTTASLSISNIVASDADTYTCKTGNTCSGFIVSSTATITVNTLPVINTQPSNVSVCTGTPANFSVSASGTGLTYLWKKDGVILSNGANITGATTNTLTILSASVSDDGTYTCEVSGTCTPKAISNGATLSVGASTTIVSQPTSKSVCSGNATVFVCNATGGAITYQWQKDGIDLVDGANISGSTTGTLTVSNASAADAGSYQCIVSSLCSSTINSAAATLTVNTSTSISSQPADVTVCAGSPASFSVTASGSSLGYQWKLNGNPISGATNASYSITATAISDAGSYTCDLTSLCNLVTTSAATLVVNSSISIVSEPGAISACTGDNITLAVTMSGAVTTYQWQKDGIDLVDGGNIAGATTSSLAINSLASSDEANYTCVMTAICGGTITTSGAQVTLSTAPVIASQPASQLVCTGQTLVLALTVTNPTGVIYQWQKDGVDLSDGGTISGATTATLTITSVTNADAGNYLCKASTSCSTPTISNTAVVTTTTSSTITKQPISADVCRTQSVLFVINIPGAGITYQWQFAPNGSTIFTDLANGGKYSGVNTNSLTTLNVDNTEVGNYRCKVTENCGAVQYSAPASIVINSPTIIQHPFSQSICTGQFAKFTIGAIGDNLVYQWYKDGVAVVNNAKI
ncbi:MAG: immunoglobulin domain-containing protein, partial [Cytophaga sp.]|uniref:immunoglobulin domain-containing protein n=1 Tax=Cytophaga sp. TaxID=29535 RepID=UPI003F7FAE02